MYYFQCLECEKCGYEVNILRKILTDKELEYYKEIREVCPSCGSSMHSKNLIQLKKCFNLSERDEILLAQRRIMLMRPEEIRIDLVELFNSGFTGLLTIELWGGEEIMFDFNPLKSEISRYDKDSKNKKLLVRKIKI